MRVAIILEKKSDFPSFDGDPPLRDSELFSDEEEDALLSGLRDAGHIVERIGDGAQLVKRAGYWKKRCDIAFNLSVGYRGLARKSYVPGVLELADIPYIGSDAYSLSLTRHKFHAKLVAGAAGVRTAPAVLWEGSTSHGRLDELTYPVIVKPVAESSSIGIAASSVVHTAAEAASLAATIARRYEQPAIVETFISGTEIEVPLLGAELDALGVVGITLDGTVVSGATFLHEDAVYENGYGFAVNPPGLDHARIVRDARIAARALGIRDYGRIDFRIAEDGTPFFMEASTHPHIQPHSSFFALAEARGDSYPAMLDAIVRVGAARLGI